MFKSLPKSIHATLALLLVAVACDSPMALLPEDPPPEASAEQAPKSIDDMSWGEILADLDRIMALEPGQRTEAEAFIASLPESTIRAYANPPNLDGLVLGCDDSSPCEIYHR